MEFWLDIAAFALKAFLIVAAVGAIALVVALASRRRRPKSDDPEIEIVSVNERFERTEDAFNDILMARKERRTLARRRKRERKAQPAPDERKRIFVVNFKGDMGATAVERLAREISAILGVARAGLDEVMIRIHSPGGSVTGYGLAAAELARLREANLALTACVDQVAASGGYMMACAAQKIIAAPFAMVGSIGVVAPVPNLHRLLKKNDVDYEEIAAGEHKRSVSLLGEITPEGRAHFREKVDEAHVAFRAFVAARRPNADIDAVGNGDHWLASDGLRLGLVDELMTSEEFLFRNRDAARLFEVVTEEQKSMIEKLRQAIGLDGLMRLLNGAGA